MTLFFLSVAAGVLTVLAPCILPLLPIIIGGAVGDTKRKPWVIITSLSLSIVLFTVILKASTALIAIPAQFWTYFSGTIIMLFGIITAFPDPWEQVSAAFKLQGRSNRLLQSSSQKKGIVGDILLGAALGPVFSSCSPTYFLILGTVLPQSYVTGLIYLFAYVIGLSLILFLIAVLGQKLVAKLRPAADAHGRVKKVLGWVFILVGVGIIFGLDKQLEVFILEQGFLNSLLGIEQQLLDAVNK